jgi:pimeloyl-ACP methyl ester carboxylesterase
MKLALLLPGYLDSPDYLHLIRFEKRLNELDYKAIRLDPCGLWRTGNTNNYTVTNYLTSIEETINNELSDNTGEILLIGHSLGGFVAILAGEKFDEVSKIIALCPPASYKDSSIKWKNFEYRKSKRDLPENPEEFREFSIPRSFAEDAERYSAIDAVKKLTKPLMIFIGLEDTVVKPELTEKLASAANDPHVVKKPDIGHDFRKSEEEINVVMNEIVKFLK